MWRTDGATSEYLNAMSEDCTTLDNNIVTFTFQLSLYYHSWPYICLQELVILYKEEVNEKRKLQYFFPFISVVSLSYISSLLLLCAIFCLDFTMPYQHEYLTFSVIVYQVA